MCKSVEDHPFKHVIRPLEANGKKYRYFSLPELKDARFERLPYCIRVLLEASIRNCDISEDTTPAHVETVLDWEKLHKNDGSLEVPFKPARVIFQDFTGLPAMADLVALREAVHRLGGNPLKVNPLCPADLVVDHSVQGNVSRTPEAVKRNQELEFKRNEERFSFLKWTGAAFRNTLVVPPGSGICHQVNLEHLSRVVFEENGLLYSDTLVGADSHTTLINGLGILGWGVSGLEAETVLFGRTVPAPLPDVVGYELVGQLNSLATSTDLVLTITKHLRELNVTGCFVEFFGDGVGRLSIAERATIASMCPEYGAIIGFFPVDAMGIKYLQQTGRHPARIAVIEAYLRAQRLLREDGSDGTPAYSRVVQLDLASVVPSISGPKRPQDRIPVAESKTDFRSCLTAKPGYKGYGLSAEHLDVKADVEFKGETFQLGHGSVVIAAITGCTNTSNPSVMLGAGLLARNAVEKGLSVRPYIRTSLSPGSMVAGRYLEASGCIPALEQLGFHITGYGCMACAGNSEPLPEPIAEAIDVHNLISVGVLSGNRNWENRAHPHVKAHYLASPLLVITYALAGTVNIDFESEPLGVDANGDAVYLRDIWPTREELQEVERRSVLPSMYSDVYQNIERGTDDWNAIAVPGGLTYPWDETSTYINRPPFLENVTCELPRPRLDKARALLILGDGVTTDIISPAGSISRNCPAARYLSHFGLQPRDLNSYGARRGNHSVMARGTFSNIKMENKMLPKAGPYAVHYPSLKVDWVYDTAMRYQADNVPLIILAGKDYGAGSCRDWAAKGPWLLGVRAIVAESFNNAHRRNLIGMGIWPLKFVEGQSAESLGLRGDEEFAIELPERTYSRMPVHVRVNDDKSFTALLLCETETELTHLRHGGVLPYVLRRLVNCCARW